MTSLPVFCDQTGSVQNYPRISAFINEHCFVNLFSGSAGTLTLSEVITVIVIFSVLDVSLLAFYR